MLDQQLILFEKEQKEDSVLGSNMVKYEPQIGLRKCILCAILARMQTEHFHLTENQFLTCINVNYPIIVLGRTESP